MSPKSVKKHKTYLNPMKTIILIILAAMLLSIAAWHVLLPALGISLVALTAGVWNIAVATIVIICVATLLFFIFTGIGVLILSMFVLIWTIVAIVLFPLLFPIVLPALILMLVIGLILRKKKG